MNLIYSVQTKFPPTNGHEQNLSFKRLSPPRTMMLKQT